MPPNIEYLEGKKFCVVFCKLEEEDKFGRCTNEEDPKFKIKTMHGRASIINNKYVDCMGVGDSKFRVPPSAYDKIFPNDGTDILQDCEFFVMVKVSGMEL